VVTPGKEANGARARRSRSIEGVTPRKVCNDGGCMPYDPDHLNSGVRSTADGVHTPGGWPYGASVAHTSSSSASTGCDLIRSESAHTT